MSTTLTIATWDGPNRLIILNNGVTHVDVPALYSEWKLWCTNYDGTKFPPFLSVLGGDPLPGGLFVGSTFFLEGAKIRPQEANHSLNISGNLFSRDGSAITVHTVGNYNVLVTAMVSSLTTAIDSGGTGASIDYELVQAAVMNAPLAMYMTDGTFGKMINDQGLRIMKVLGLVHQNIMIDATQYDDDGNLISARVTLWENAADVGTSNNILATYNMTCNTSGAGKFSIWKQVLV